MREIKLGNTLLGPTSLPYIIAEIGVNHEGSMDMAKRLIDLAKEGGADAAKFQTYKAETLASKNSPSYWDTKKEKTKSQYQLFKKYDGFEPDDYYKLADHCKSVDIQFLSTPFDLSAVDFLGPISPFFKIASADITNLPLLEKTAQTSRPVILSTGASNISEIHEAVSILNNNGCTSVALLHCVLNYPTPDENAHLGMITGLLEEFPETVIGYSDHTLPGHNMLPCTLAYSLGARIIEKHFTNDKTLPGNDHYHAMDVQDLKILRSNLEEVRLLTGNEIPKQALPTEELSRENARRSLVAARDLLRGAVLTEDDLICKRPGIGISPMKIYDVIGRTLSTDRDADDTLRWEDLEAV